MKSSLKSTIDRLWLFSDSVLVLKSNHEFWGSLISKKLHKRSKCFLKSFFLIYFLAHWLRIFNEFCDFLSEKKELKKHHELARIMNCKVMKSVDSLYYLFSSYPCIECHCFAPQPHGTLLTKVPENMQDRFLLIFNFLCVFWYHD